jgi:hypothetical protein
MTYQYDPLHVLWADDLDQLDHEIARLALLCQVPILNSGVIERVLQRDASVCGTDNPVAFRKLHDMIMLHFAMRQKAADRVGQELTAAIEAEIIERLKKSFPGMGELPFGARDA